MRARGVYAALEGNDVFFGDEVRRREKGLFADALAVAHDPLHRKEVAEKRRCPLHIAVSQKRADIGRRNGHAVLLHTGDNITAEAVGGAVGLELFYVPLVLVAKAVIMPCHKMHRVILPDEQLRDKILPRHGHHVSVERLNKDLLHAVLRANDLRSLGGRCQQRHALSRDELARRTVERKGRGAAAALACAAHRHFEQLAVPDMHPVEKAEGDDCGFIHGFAFLLCQRHTLKKFRFEVRSQALASDRARNVPSQP